MFNFFKSFFSFKKKEKGQTIVDYSLIVAVLVLVSIAAIPGLRNGVSSVFSRVGQTLDDPSILDAHTQDDYEYWDTLDYEQWSDEWYTTETKLGTGVSEIAVNLAEKMIAYRQETGLWFPGYDEEGFSGVAWDYLNDSLEEGWTQEEVDMWKRTSNVDGVLYTPYGDKISVEPGVGYYFTFADVQGIDQVMEYEQYGNGLLSDNLNLVMDDQGTWRAYWESGDNKVVDIDTLRVHFGDSPPEN